MTGGPLFLGDLRLAEPESLREPHLVLLLVGIAARFVQGLPMTNVPGGHQRSTIFGPLSTRL